MSSGNNFDLVVIGSGFAGSLISTILSKAGLRVALIDKGRHPRFAIGESSTPIANMILRDLSIKYNLDYLMPLCRFGTWREHYPDINVGMKRGFSYLNHSILKEFDPGPNHQNELFVSASSSNYDSDTQWFRSEFDYFLVKKAKEHGVLLLQNCSVENARFAKGAWELKLDHAKLEAITTKFIVDASGSGACLPKLQNLKSNLTSVKTNTKAVFCHSDNYGKTSQLYDSFADARYDHPYDVDESVVHHLLDAESWQWQIRFVNGITSHGLVVDQNRNPTQPLAKQKEVLRKFPSLNRLKGEASPVKYQQEQIVTDRIQRRWETATGPSWALLPHCYGFVDPLHSTGIAWSLHGIEKLSSIILQHWDNKSMKDHLENYSNALSQEYEFIDSLCSINYRCLGDFDKWRAASMLYFAASIDYENLRTSNYQKKAFLTSENFLSAGKSPVMKMVEEAHMKCSDHDFKSWTRRCVESHCEVNLFSPETRNMFFHTAAKI